jgi:hypothetical protein
MKYLILPALLAAGCVANDADLTIDRFVPALRANSCVVSPMQMEQPLNGLLDTGLAAQFGTPYAVFPVITNHLAASTTAQGGVETHSITVKGANVELQPDATLGAAIPPAQRKFFAAVPNSRLDPGGSVAVEVDVIPRALASKLGGAGSLTALVSPVGDYGGDTVVGAARAYPIEVCSFCLTGGSPTACPPDGFSPMAVDLGECIPSQDANVTCCFDTQNQFLCGAQVPMAKM